MDKFNSPLSKKFKNYEKDSPGSNWDSFQKKRKESTALGDKFIGFEMNSASAGWAFFEKRKKRKAALVFWFVKLPLMIGMLAVAYFTNLRRQNPMFEKKDKIVNVAKGDSNNAIAFDNSSNNLIARTEKEDIESHSKNRNVKSNRRLRTTNGKEKLNGTLVNRGPEKTPSGLIGQLSESTLDLVSHEDLNSDEFENVTPRIELNLGGRLGFESSLIELDRMGLKLLPNPNNKMEKLDFNPDFTYKLPSLWSLYVKGGVNYTSSKIKARPESKDLTNKYYKKTTESAEIPAIGYDFQIAAQYRYLANVSFKAGLGFSKQRIGGKYNHEIDSVPFVGLRGTIQYLPPNKDSMDEPFVTGKAGYSYTYLNIPLGIVVNKPLNQKWGAIVDFSAELSVLLNAEGSKLNEVYLDEIESFTSNNLRKLNASLNIGPGIMRTVNKDL